MPHDALVMTVVLFAATLVGLWRTASAPLRGAGEHIEADRATRRVLARFIMLLSSGALLAYAGGLLFVAGSATRNVARGTTVDGVSGADTGLRVLGTTELFSGLVLGIAGIALTVSALSVAIVPRAARIPTTAR